MGQRDGGGAAVAEPNERVDAGLFGGFGHFAGFLQGPGDRLLAGARLAGGDSGLRRRSVHKVRGHDVDQTDLGLLHKSFPVVGNILPAPQGTKGRVFVLLTEDGVHYRAKLRPEEFIHLAPGDGVGTSHKPLANHRDIDRLRHN